MTAGRPERAAIAIAARVASGADLPRLRSAMEETAAREADVCGEQIRYCPVCARQGNDDSRLGVERVHHVEGAPPEGLLADVCERGHVFPLGDDDKED